ncbi:UDP-N-acetylglucosamine transferase subunit alg14 [Tolypocladium paradoxum]|uniref:UDP-N-acetylglucosamine transferase subunit alg14 n=1 Tax=Tolypocladium paradoxum TaxID=94208 RepID=A0A2S4KYK7_9HYPO|nr:UDP-N-acetylglucosamine transferase subunit alg14 [Tolypocladium paradoxum]
MSSERSSIIDWCMGVPTWYERDDPFQGDGFQPRPGAAAAAGDAAEEAPEEGSEPESDDQPEGDAQDEQPVDYPEDLPPRPPGRRSWFRTGTPLLGSSNSSRQRPSHPSTALEVRHNSKKRKLSRFLGLLSRKRKARNERGPLPQAVIEVLQQPVYLNFLFIGSKGSGQTSLLFRSSNGYFPDVRFPSSEPSSDVNLEADARQTGVCHGPADDSSGAPDLNTVERLSCLPWHGIFLCFDVHTKLSLRAIIQWWPDSAGQWRHAKSRGFASVYQGFDPLIYVVGLKRDLRLNIPPGYTERDLVDRDEAKAEATSINAEHYHECSAKTSDGMDALFNDAADEAARRVLQRRHRDILGE